MHKVSFLVVKTAMCIVQMTVFVMSYKRDRVDNQMRNLVVKPICKRSVSVFSILYRFKTFFVLIQNKLNFVLIQNDEISVIFLCLQAKLFLF